MLSHSYNHMSQWFKKVHKYESYCDKNVFMLVELCM